MIDNIFRMGIDIDGTVNDFDWQIKQHTEKLLKQVGCPYHDIDYNKYEISERYNISEDLASAILTLFDYRQLRFNEDFENNCHHLNDPTIEVYFITHRKPDMQQYGLAYIDGVFVPVSTLEQVTRLQLNDLKVRRKDLVFTDDKAKTCRELRIDLMIEDCPKELENLLDNNITCLKREFRYNDYIPIGYVRNWDTFLSTFKNSYVPYLIKTGRYKKFIMEAVNE